MSKDRARRVVQAGGGCRARWSHAKIFLASATLTSATLLAPSAFQHAYAFDFFTSGRGKASCGDYLAASKGLEPNIFRKMTKEQRVFVSENNAYDQWIYGFYSAMNFASVSEGNKHPDIQVSNAEMLAWIREWCGTRPSETVLQAAISFTRDQWRRAPVQFVFVTFQQNVSNDDLTAFLQAYKVSIAESPKSAGGFYKLRFAEPLPSDQLQSLLDSMKGQPRIVSNAVAN